MLFISTMRPTLCLGPVLADNGWFSLPALRPHRAGPAPQAHRTSGPASSPTLARPQPPDSAASDPLSAAPFLLFDGSRASLLHTQRIAPAPLSRYRSSLSPQRIASLRYSSQRRHPAAGPLVSFLRAQFLHSAASTTRLDPQCIASLRCSSPSHPAGSASLRRHHSAPQHATHHQPTLQQTEEATPPLVRTTPPAGLSSFPHASRSRAGLGRLGHHIHSPAAAPSLEPADEA